MGGADEAGLGDAAGEAGRGGGIVTLLLLKAAPGQWEDEGFDLAILIAVAIAVAFYVTRLRNTKDYGQSCLGSLGCLATMTLAYLLVSPVSFYWAGRTTSFGIIVVIAILAVLYMTTRLIAEIPLRIKPEGSKEGRGQGPAPSD